MANEAFDYRAATMKMLERAKQLTGAVERLCNEFSEETGLPVHNFGVRRSVRLEGDYPVMSYAVQVNLGLPTTDPQAAAAPGPSIEELLRKPTTRADS